MVSSVNDHNSSKSPSLSDKECELSGSDVDRREYLREQRQNRSKQLGETIGSACGRRRGQGVVRARGRRGGEPRSQDPRWWQYAWLEENTRRNLKQFTSAVEPPG